jgi:hypothetical protein
MSYTKRKTERLQVKPGSENDSLAWVECDLIDVKKGHIFRSWEPGAAPDQWTPQIDPGGAVCVALEDAQPLEGYDDGRAGVSCMYLNGFDEMSWCL